MSSGPHIHSRDNSRRIMLDVILALLPASIAGVISMLLIFSFINPINY